MNINYIYNTKGNIESVIVPYYIWDALKVYAEKIEVSENERKEKEFNPSEFCGLLSHRNLNIEQELQDMRDQWTRTI